MMKSFLHDDAVWSEHPALAAHVVHVGGLKGIGDTTASQAGLLDDARRLLGEGTESDLPAIKAWRQAFGAMGLKPTKYRSASESLLRRFRKSGDMPQVHPFVDLCNAVSLAYALPVAAFDPRRVEGQLIVTKAEGSEQYHAFDGRVEAPDPGEIVFCDDAGRAHARRWAHRQSAYSAMSEESQEALVVIEGFHDSAGDDQIEMVRRITEGLEASGTAGVLRGARLTRDDASFVLEEDPGAE